MCAHEAERQSPKRDDEALKALVDGLGPLRAIQRKVADALVRLERVGHHLAEGCASVVELATRNGYEYGESRTLLALGRALAADADLRERVEAGRVQPSAGAVLSRVLLDPGLQREDDRWVDWAEHETLGELGRRVRTRIEETRQRGTVQSRRIEATEDTWGDFERSRQIASRRSALLLTPGQMLGLLATDWRLRNDPLLQPGAPRRLPDTAGIRSRYVPAAVEREVRQRAMDRCQVPGCGCESWLYLAHVIPHREGGSREADNLLLLCWRHHRLFDLGLLRLIGGDMTNPVFADALGRVVGRGVPHDDEEPSGGPSLPSGGSPPGSDGTGAVGEDVPRDVGAPKPKEPRPPRESRRCPPPARWRPRPPRPGGSEPQPAEDAGPDPPPPKG